MISKKQVVLRQRPLPCGALIAGASETNWNNWSFGEAVGIGFQVRDDLLNLNLRKRE
ncbi:MAG: hypothetical protein CM1200mP28_17470 [Deltaproteobacteria bacterium]|nr:MAG: hypothetical protein CM1200mP28_17470 [Deltaproteobacteria bacterium]